MVLPGGAFQDIWNVNFFFFFLYIKESLPLVFLDNILACIVRLLSGFLPLEVKSKRGSDFKIQPNELEGYSKNTYCLTVLTYIYTILFLCLILSLFIF